MGYFSLYVDNMVVIEIEVYVQFVDNVIDGSLYVVKI